jgi:hypothetical protein
MLDAAAQLGVDPAVAIMAVAYGGQWSNMIQPFWALPLLAIAGFKMRDILDYATVTFIASGLVFGADLVAGWRGTGNGRRLSHDSCRSFTASMAFGGRWASWFF